MDGFGVAADALTNAGFLSLPQVIPFSKRRVCLLHFLRETAYE